MWQRLMVRLLWWRYVKALGRASDRGPAPVYPPESTPSDQAEPSFALVRIIGNDLAPRHRPGQSLKNLGFILENEAAFPQCTKIFVLNRIVDSDVEARLIELLESHRARFLRLPFDLEEAVRQPWDLNGVPGSLLPPFRHFARLWPVQAGEVLMRLYRHRNNALINNNGARNVALAAGRPLAEWIMPWDGNCFLTESGWQRLRQSVLENPGLPYRIIPLARLADNQQLLNESFVPGDLAEPQIMFRRDALQEFDPRFYYGRRPKVELLWRLGVPGPWDRWGIQPWDWPCPDYAPDAGAWCQAGWVARLASGRPDLERRVSRQIDRRRADARAASVLDFLDGLQTRLIESRWDGLECASLLGAQAADPDRLLACYRQLQDLAPDGKLLRWEDLNWLFAHLFLADRVADANAQADAEGSLMHWFGSERSGVLALGPTGSGLSARSVSSQIRVLVGLYWALPALARLERRGMAVPAGFDKWLRRLEHELLGSGRLSQRLLKAESSIGFSRDLVAMSVALYRRRADALGSASFTVACRLARIADMGFWRRFTGGERVDCLVLLSCLSDLTACFGVPLWRYPSESDSWMAEWLEECLRGAGSGGVDAGRLFAAAAGFQRHFGHWPGAWDHSISISEQANPLIRPCADMDWVGRLGVSTGSGL